MPSHTKVCGLNGTCFLDDPKLKPVSYDSILKNGVLIYGHNHKKVIKMQLIGFNLGKILVERKEQTQGKLEISQNIDIKDISKEKISISKDDALKVQFSFTINYSNDFAKLEFEGHVLLLPQESELKSILKSWKDKKIQDEVRIPLFNFIMSKCNVKALTLEDEMALPLHIPMPRLNPNEKQ